MDRHEVYDRIKAVIDARQDRDYPRAAKLIAPDATYAVAAKDGSLPGFPDKDDDAMTAFDKLVKLIEYRKVDYLDSIVEGHRAMVLMRVAAEAHGVEHELLLCGIWELDADGRAISLVEYTDTAAMRDWLVSGAAATAPVPLPQDDIEIVATP